ncbi:DUF2127 domain-containing protein [Ectopseudomonas khazarica]|uniref:DUF2127 domain-containing protein n=1 Tax=Ectopseudomonas khazarica TaxID=2502979 RepID=UPI003850011C
MAHTRPGLRLIAAMEACKGLISLVVALGLHELAGRNLQQVAEALVSHAHLNPASHLPGIFLHAVKSLPDIDLSLLAIGALAYAVIRLIEAYGLWKGLLWTEWFALASGAIYLPFEVYEMLTRSSALSAAVFVLNLLVVAYMARVLLVQRGQASHPR